MYRYDISNKKIPKTLQQLYPYALLYALYLSSRARNNFRDCYFHMNRTSYLVQGWYGKFSDIIEVIKSYSNNDNNYNNNNNREII